MPDICDPQACQSERDSAHGSTPPKGHVRAFPPASWAMPLLSWVIARLALPEPPARTYDGQTQDRLGRGVGAVGDQPGRRTPPVDVEVAAIGIQHLPVDRVDGQGETSLEETGERRVGLLERGVPLPQRPDRAGEPVRRVAVRRVGQLDRLRARVQGAVGLHPQHDVAGVPAGDGLQVGQATQHLERARSAGRVLGLLPVADVDDGGARQVVGVERALSVGVLAASYGPPPMRL